MKVGFQPVVLIKEIYAFRLCRIVSEKSPKNGQRIKNLKFPRIIAFYKKNRA